MGGTDMSSLPEACVTPTLLKIVCASYQTKIHVKEQCHDMPGGFVSHLEVVSDGM